MIKGKFESLKTMHAVSSAFVTEVHAWGRFEKHEPETFPSGGVSRRERAATRSDPLYRTPG